jgi:lipid-binding SYLF domain-containing protein
MSIWKLLSVAAVLSLSVGCVWKPVTYDVSTRESVEKATAEFREEEALGRFFDDAVGYVVFPSAVRAGSGFGGAYGSGWLMEAGDVTGRTILFELFLGPNLGAQAYRSILFFQNEKSLQKFKKGRFEFTGQANAAVVTVGVGFTPSYNNDVAMFTQLRGGLLLEASVGTQRYDFYPLVENINE